MVDPKGEGLKVGFDGSLRLEFRGAKVTSDAGLLAYRDLDEALGLFVSVPSVFHDLRTGCNIQHDLTALLRQSVYSRLAGYEDVNDAHRLSVDPTMRRITGKKIGGHGFSWEINQNHVTTLIKDVNTELTIDRLTFWNRFAWDYIARVYDTAVNFIFNPNSTTHSSLNNPELIWQGI